MKKISFIKGIVLSAFLSITLLSCQSDDSDVVHNSTPEATFKFATDASGRMADSIPPQILKIMHDDFLTAGDQVKSRQLTNTYDLESGKLTPEASLSGKFSNSKQVVETSSTNYASSYRAHMSGHGWLPWASYGQTIGAINIGAQIEAIEFAGMPLIIISHGRAHVQGLGWMNPQLEVIGTIGLSRRLEALTTVNGGYHRAHVEKLGWMPWVKCNQPAGTEGLSLRMEAYEASQYNY